MFFFQGKAPQGLHVSAGFQIALVSGRSKVTGETASTTGFSIPLLIGYNWIFGERIGFGLSVGGGIQILTLSVLGFSAGGVLPTLKLALGIGF